METQKKSVLFISVASLVISTVSVASASVLASASGARAARAEIETQTRNIAHDVVREEWLKNLAEETKKIASDAARDAADRAIREAVVPMALRAEQNYTTDLIEHKDLYRRLAQLEYRAGVPGNKR